MSRGDGGFVASWLLLRVVVLFVVLGAAAYDVGSVGWKSLTTQESADRAAAAGAHEWKTTQDVQVAYQAALRRAQSDGLTIEPAEFTVVPNGSVNVSVHGVADTVIIRRIHALRSWAQVEASATANPALALGLR